MRIILFFCVFWAGLISLGSSHVSAIQTDVIKRMTSGGHILMIRHALAPGSGDPTNFTIGDCTTQRNLDESGRNQARKIGDWLRSNGVTSARVYSSQWCRCLETAALIGIGSVRELPALNSFYERVQDREPNIAALKSFIKRQPVDGELIILVTHFVTIAAITGSGVSSGEAVLMELDIKETYRVIERIDFGQ